MSIDFFHCVAYTPPPQVLEGTPTLLLTSESLTEQLSVRRMCSFSLCSVRAPALCYVEFATNNPAGTPINIFLKPGPMPHPVLQLMPLIVRQHMPQPMT